MSTRQRKISHYFTFSVPEGRESRRGRAWVYFFSTSYALWNAEPIPPGSAKRNKKKPSVTFLRAGGCASSEAGG
jgi:hypothetical protein